MPRNDFEPDRSPLVDKLMTMEERWDEACAGVEPPAHREWHMVHTMRQIRDDNSSHVFTRKDLNSRVNELDG